MTMDDRLERTAKAMYTHNVKDYASQESMNEAWDSREEVREFWRAQASVAINAFLNMAIL